MRRALVCAIGLLVLGAPAAAQRATLPANLELALLLKVLSFDRTLESSQEVVVAFVYQPEVPASIEKRDAWVAQTRAPLTIGNTPVRVVPVRFEDTESLIAALRENDATLAMLPPLRAVNTLRVAERVRASGIRTATNDAELARRATSIGLVLRAGKPHIMINLPHAREEKCDYSSQLLRIAEVIN